MILRIGAWGGRSAVLEPKRAAAQVVQLGLTDICLCLESQWNAANGRAFDPFLPPAGLAASLDTIQQAATKAGHPVRTHVLTYPQATQAWASSAVDYIHELLRHHRVTSVEDDAEENWSARTAPERAVAAQLYRASLANAGVRRGVTGIVYADHAKLAPLTATADYVTPQGYSTTVGRVAPGHAQRLAWARWQAVARVPSRCVMGLAAYGQEGAGDMSTADAMHVAWLAAEAIGVEEVRYWSLSALTGDAGRFVASRCTDLRRALKDGPA